MNGQPRRGSLIGPAVVIGFGVILLLNNLGVLVWSVWDIAFRLWPILLIAVGLDLAVGHRSIWGSLLGLVLLLAVLAVALWLFAANPGVGGSGTAVEINRALGDAERADITIDRSFGALRIGALSDSSNLVEGTLHVRGSEEVVRDYSLSHGVVALAIKSEHPSWGPFGPGLGEGEVWELGLTPRIPLQLNINLGVGQSDIDLSRLLVRDMQLSTGVGRVTVVLPGGGRSHVQIDGGIGDTVVIVPVGTEVRVDLGTALVSREVPGEWERRGDAYVSPGYDGAEVRVDLELGQAIGRVALRQASPMR